jgi:two-component system, cell cycle response regulator DivK
MGGELILVVEDDAKSRRLVHDVLEHEGYRVAEATAGDEGVRLAKELVPALILMDLQLPGLDGIAALGLIRQDPATRAIPVVAVTASAMAHDRPKIRAAGFDGHQRKPIHLKEFVALVRTMIESRPPGGA